MYDATAITKTKTETRRTHGLQEINKYVQHYGICHTGFSIEGRLMVTFRDPEYKKNGTKPAPIVKSRFKRGEILYLAEPMWIKSSTRPGLTALEIPHEYIWDRTIDYSLHHSGYKKISPLLMKQEYGRHFIKILDVGCEQVQEISDEAVLREGISPPSTDLKPGMLKAMYASLFDKVNTPGLWDLNPFVFVYSFEYLPDFKRRLHQC